MLNRRALIAAPLLAVPALVLAGCGASADGAESADGEYTIVASTSVYASLAEQVVGDAAEVTAIIDSATQDPHDYEATARDQLAVQDADLVIMNGGGYDHFMEELIDGANDGSGREALTVVAFNHDYPNDGEAEEAHDHAEDEHGEHADEEHDEHEHNHIEGFNEHVWYDPHTVEHFVEAMAEGLEERIPGAADDIAANAESVITEIGSLEDQLAEIEQAHAGATVFFTEPVGGYLAAAAGLEDVTTEGFAESVEAGQDVAPATLLDALESVEGGDVDVLVVNAQTGGSETDRLIEAAEREGVPVVEFAETLPEGSTYAEWMTDNVDALATALDD
ncbi:metal ABC transporter solute-binding protein, Zn/Mn family [Microbacterium sp. G2-8]|uniref:metal ABC transporter solute-binding protein, Zn/Mn family n=1 Tax=Microbacterium sp. G2-8 TaxID=2842454 RepID=UPI001C89B2C1|nr:zinc ABC transporter substrate-binding protein [Microbacterium sp. G2-8]